MRPDFDYTCECGYYHCGDCGCDWYPMEINPNGYCPDCLGELEFISTTEE